MLFEYLTFVYFFKDFLILYLSDIILEYLVLLYLSPYMPLLVLKYKKSGCRKMTTTTCSKPFDSVFYKINVI